jgi:hypothetical protein
MNRRWLNYMPGTGRRPIRRTARVAILLAIGAGLLLATREFGPGSRSDLWLRSPMRQWQDWRAARSIRAAAVECMRHSDPPGHVVYEEGPAASREWVTGGSGFVESLDGTRLIRSRRPQCLSRVLSGARLDPQLAPILVHELRAPDGWRRPVLAFHFPVPQDPRVPDWSLTTGTAKLVEGERLAGLPPGVELWEYYTILFPRLGRDQILRVKGGQPDSADPSHASVGYELDGRSGTFDLWLRDDGALTLSPRDGPAVAMWRAEHVQLPQTQNASEGQ